MYKLNHWSDVPGRRIEEVEWRAGQATVRFELDEGILEIESAELGMPVSLSACRPSDQASGGFDIQTLVGLVIRRLDVPFVAKDFKESAIVTMGFDEGPDVCLASTDPFIPLRIT
ncbi:hypothetical protein D3C72_445130 [compost metagenome]